MKCKCLVLNNREPIPETLLSDVDDRLDVVWYQRTGTDFSLTLALQEHSDTKILISTYMDLCQENLEILASLEVIITTTISTHFVDSDYCKKKNIKIFNTANYTGSSVAEHAVALMMNATRKITDIGREVQTGNMQCFDYPGMELFGKTAGIIGFGEIGSYIARLLNGFGMDLIYVNRSKKNSPFANPVDLDTLVSHSDIVFLTLPLNNASHAIMNDAIFDKMKPTAILVNISPDDVIDRDALIQALQQEKIAYAAMDLLNPEYYIGVPHTILTPRRAWYTTECFDRRIHMWKQTLVDYLSSQLQQTSLDHLDFVQIENA